MKETNMEHYRGEIEAVGHDFALINGKVAKCNRCEKCYFETQAGEIWESCTVKRVRWLMTEYKPEPVLTAREKGFVECIANGYIAKSQKGQVRWFFVKPNKYSDYWAATGLQALIDPKCFPFITWEDEEPWALEDLRKLKVGDQDA